MQNISPSSSSSTSSPSKSIFVQDGHRPSNHCIQMATWPQAQLKTATGFKHGHGEVLRASPAASSADASSVSTVRSAWAALGNRGEIQNEIVPLSRARVVPIQSPRAATGFPQPCGRRSFRTQAVHAATCHVQGSDWGPAGETAVDRSLDTGVGLKASATKSKASPP